MRLKWKPVSVRLEIVLMLSQDRRTVCDERIIGSKIVLDAPDGTSRRRWSCGISLHLGIVLILTQDSCTVCVERAIGSKIIWTHLMEFLGDMGHVESHFFLFGDNVSVSAR